MSYQRVYQDKVAVVTGGASGIGAALAEHLSSLGAKVVIADRQIELAQSLADAIRSRGGSALAKALDVRELASIQRVVDETLAHWGGIDYFFNNAGIGVGAEVTEHTTRDWDDVLDVNLRGVIHGIQAVYPVMIRHGSGHIVNTASVAGLVAGPHLAAYNASKHAVVGLSKTLRIEAKAHGVRVSVLCPGVIRTPILQGGTYGRIKTPPAARAELDAYLEGLRPMTPAAFAQRALVAVARNQAIIVVPSFWKLLWYLDRLSPALSLALMSAGYSRMRALAQAFESDASLDSTPQSTPEDSALASFEPLEH